jgi:hypothetical protein
MVQVFEADAGGQVIAFLGAMGGDGLLIWRDDRGWEFHEPNSLAWDSQHQATYRNSRSTPTDEAGLQARGIPWPDPATWPRTSRQWKDNFVSAIPFSPALESALGALAGGATLPVHLILFEDRYETAFGDGKFLYPHAAFWDAEQCQTCLQRLREEEQLKDAAGFHSLGHAFTARELTICLDAQARQVVADLRIEAYEHYHLNDVLLLLDPRMAWKGETSSAWWRAAVEPGVLERLESMRHEEEEEQVWVVSRNHDSSSPFGSIRQPVVEAAFWTRAEAEAFARQAPGLRWASAVRICAHQPGERLVGTQAREGLALHNVLALLAFA